MILQTQKQQLAFLDECYKHIQRIYKTHLTDSERKDAAGKGRNPPYLHEKDELLGLSKLPRSIDFSGWLHNVKMGKLYLLVAVYNAVATKINETTAPLDLNPIFKTTKHELDSQLLSRIHVDSDKLMQTHRSHSLRIGLLRFLNRIFAPKSKIFLDKYGFFESKKTLPLNEAVRELQIKKVRALVSPQTVNQKDNYGFGQTPLRIAADRDDVDLIKLLIEKGAVVDSDALNSAIQAGNLDAVRVLLQNGGNVNSPDESGTTPLRNALHYISYQGFQNSSWTVRVDIINELLKQPIDWDAHTHKGETIFLYASFIGSWSNHPNRDGFEQIYNRLMKILAQKILQESDAFKQHIMRVRELVEIVKACPEHAETFILKLFKNPDVLKQILKDEQDLNALREIAPPRFDPIFNQRNVAPSLRVATALKAAELWIENNVNIKQAARTLWVDKQRGTPLFANFSKDMIIKTAAHTRQIGYFSQEEAETIARDALENAPVRQ